MQDVTIAALEMLLCYKPHDSLFDAVAEKEVLILSPWEYDPNKKHISRADCVALNNMAEEICDQLTLRGCYAEVGEKVYTLQGQEVK